ncbi:MAG: nucleotidyl transferase AbiEii/AbiGii toxin family protein [Candidatus Aminicenantes bacterium]|nr:nucleotidyl transferase AbiEii/AbiGii toxin family protein [Candidatus Aminicenantes bacterium]
MLDQNVHKTILLQILKDIYTDASLGPVLGFKGGTAAHFFYGLSRFSVDLDFDLLNEDAETLVFEGIEKILREYGTIKEKYRKQHTLLFVISYDEKAQNVKVEINRRIFGSRYELKNYLGISMLVMVREDMFAHKLVAMLERTKRANRDIFDVWYFLKHNWPINEEIVKKRTKMPFREYLGKCIKFIESTSDRGILHGMGELLDEKHKVWVKANLRKDAVFLLKILSEQQK